MFIDSYIGQQYVLMQRTASKCGEQKTTKKITTDWPFKAPRRKVMERFRYQHQPTKPQDLNEQFGSSCIL